MDSSFVYIHDYNVSSAQEQFVKQRVVEQRRQRKRHQNSSFLPQDPLAACYSLSSYPSYPLARTTSGGSATDDRPASSISGVALQQQACRDSHKREASSYGEMESARLPSSRSSSSSTSEQAHQSLLSNPFELRHGRRYLRDLPYPLPVDLAEIHRQNLKTLLKCKAFGGRAVCSPNVKKRAPTKVLEVACGSGFWSAKCHEYFSSLGHKNVSFTGLDVAPLAPDMRKQGINWKFVQHDLRRVPWPFEDETFDFVMLKDTSLVMTLGVPSQKMIDESLRVLSEGGTLEIWETDHIFRSILPHPPAVAKTVLDRETAAKLGVFLVLPGTPFASPQNKYIQHANGWIQEALHRKKLPPTPCTIVAPSLYQEADQLHDIGTLRIAIPLGELRWEKEGAKHGRSASEANDSLMAKGKGKVPAKFSLLPEQAALRQTALLVVLQKIESLEPILKEASGKNTEEWSHWWASMMNDLLNPAGGGGVTSEVLEAGAWWATKTSS